MKNIPYIFLALGWLTFLSACHSTPHPQEHEEGTEEHDHASNATVTLTAAQMKSIGVELGHLEKKQLTASLKANGILHVPNQNRASVTALMGGVVQQILVQTGNVVRRGQTIATISNPEFISMQQDFLSTTAKTTLAKAEYERQKTLQQGQASSQKSFQQAEAEYQALFAKQAGLKKQLELLGVSTAELSPDKLQSFIRLVSPISGSVSQVTGNIGSYVAANNPIAEIVDNSQLHLDLYVYEKDLKKLQVGQTIHFTLTNNPGKEYDADIYAISNTFEPNMKAVAVHAQVKGDKRGLIDGMNVTALVSLKQATVEAVPTQAIIQQDGQDFVFVALPDSTNSTGHGASSFEKIPVKVGTTDVGYSEITLLKEIAADRLFVVNGAFFIWAKMTNQGEAHEH